MTLFLSLRVSNSFFLVPVIGDESHYDAPFSLPGKVNFGDVRRGSEAGRVRGVGREQEDKRSKGGLVFLCDEATNH